jgi:hypothetical protein
VAETTVKTLPCCGFRHTGKAMLVKDMSRNSFSFQVRMSHVLRFISMCDLFTDSPSYVDDVCSQIPPITSRSTTPF